MKKRILIVEDNRILSENFLRIFRNSFEAILAESASEAIEHIDRQIPDLIFLDILLSGHSAFSLLNELQSYPDTSKIPVVICSDLASELEEVALKKYNVVKILDKSLVEPREILEVCSYATN